MFAMNSPVPSWKWYVPLLVTIFALGTAFGRFVSPFLFRDDVVLVIHGSEPAGCHGRLRHTPVRFGRSEEPSNGSYSIKCDERFSESYNLQLHCGCRD